MRQHAGASRRTAAGSSSDRFPRPGGGVIEQVPDQAIDPLGFGQGAGDNFPLPAGSDLVLDQSQVADQGAQGVADLVRHAGGQMAHRGHFLGADQFIAGALSSSLASCRERICASVCARLSLKAAVMRLKEPASSAISIGPVSGVACFRSPVVIRMVARRRSRTGRTTFRCRGTIRRQ